MLGKITFAQPPCLCQKSPAESTFYQTADFADVFIAVHLREECASEEKVRIQDST